MPSVVQFAARAVAASLAMSMLPAAPADACTTFALGSSRIVAKSYDWHIDQGRVMINKRGVEKRGLAVTPTDRPPSWTSTYGSLTFNQYGREFPNAGLNEAGLTVEVMVLDESEFPAADDTASLNETQWVQYQLDRFATVDEVVAHAEDLRVARIMAPLHYMVCDAGGACAAFEFLGGRLAVREGAAFGVQVLANDTYAASVAHLARFAGFGGTQAVPASGLGSLTRFVRAADHVRRGGAVADPVAYAFAGIAKVAGPSTQWRIVYEAGRGVAHFASRSAPAVKRVSLAGQDLSCASPVQVLDMRRSEGGDATAALRPFDPADNRALVRSSLAGQLPEAVVALAADYPATTRCVAP